MTFHVISCLIVIIFCSASIALEDEPVFTKLKYDKEMLETMVRMEAKMAQWDTERKEFEETVTAILAHRREETQESFAAQNKNIKSMFEDYNNIRDELTNKTAHLEEVAETLGKTPKLAFNAYTTSGGSFIDNERIILPLVLLNEGNGYNNDTGVFTAPVSGLYQFNAHICGRGANYMVVAIVHNNTDIAVTTEHEDSGNSCSSVSAPAIMNANDQVFIKSGYSASKLQANVDFKWPSFTGFLVHK